MAVSILHRNIADWQDAASEQRLHRRGLRHILRNVNFSTNFTLMHGAELKGEFYDRPQVSNESTQVSMVWPPALEPHIDSDERCSYKYVQGMFYLSDDNNHDSHFAHATAVHNAHHACDLQRLLDQPHSCKRAVLA